MLKIALLLLAVVCLGKDWSDPEFAPPPFDYFGRPIVKFDKLALHLIHDKTDNRIFPMPLPGAVHDGDTFTLILQFDHLEGAKGTWIEEIRIADIDAPEKGQPLYDAARKRLVELVHYKPVVVEPISRGRYRRVIARVYDVYGKDIALQLLREGFVRCYKTCKRKDYLAAEKDARDHKRGIWK